VGRAEALSAKWPTNDIISERYDYVSRVESQDHVTVRIKLGNAADVQCEPGLLTIVDDKVRLKTGSYLGKDAYIFGVFPSLDSEQALCCVSWSFVGQEEVHLVIERYVVIEIVGESTPRAPTKSQVMTLKGKNLPTNFVGWDFRVIRDGLVLRLRNQATERQQQRSR
jgi:hypothetical protein